MRAETILQKRDGGVIAVLKARACVSRCYIAKLILITVHSTFGGTRTMVYYMKVKFSDNCSQALSARTASISRERKKTPVPARVLCSVLLCSAAWPAAPSLPGPRHPQPPSIIPYGQLAGQVYTCPNGPTEKYQKISYPI